MLPLQTPNQHKAFMAEETDSLAMAAYQGYLQYGRGLVIVLTPGETTSNALMEQLNLKPESFSDYFLLIYQSFDQYMTLSVLRPETDQYTRRLIRKYNPEREIVVLIPHGRGTSTYRSATFPRSPKGIYEAEQAERDKLSQHPLNREIVSEEDQSEFLQTYLPLLSAFAYTHYLRSGKGVILAYTGISAAQTLPRLKLFANDPSMTTINPNNFIVYVPLDRYREQYAVDDEYAAGIANSLDTLKPDTSFKIVFDNNRFTKAYTITPNLHELQPKQAYQTMIQLEHATRHHRGPNPN